MTASASEFASSLRFGEADPMRLRVCNNSLVSTWQSPFKISRTRGSNWWGQVSFVVSDASMSMTVRAWFLTATVEAAASLGAARCFSVLFGADGCSLVRLVAARLLVVSADVDPRPPPPPAAPPVVLVLPDRGCSLVFDGMVLGG